MTSEFQDEIVDRPSQWSERPPTREIVVWTWRLLLGRDPDNEAMIDACCRLPSVGVLRDNIMAAAEFQIGVMSVAFKDRARPVVRAETSNNRLMYLNLSDPLVSCLCLIGKFEPRETALVRRLLKPGDGFLDAGASIGWFTLLAAETVGPAGHVYAFEPASSSRALLSRSVEESGFSDRVTIYRAGVWDKPDRRLLRWDKDGSHPGGATLNESLSPETHDAEEVDLITIDGAGIDWPIDVFKIDIEGAEYRAMLGAEALVNRYRPVILSELFPDGIRAVSKANLSDYVGLLSRWGFDCFLLEAEQTTPLDPEAADRISGVHNVVFVPRERGGASALM
jgi:FkbM family methyltransferase